jgi:hypothetical protein
MAANQPFVPGPFCLSLFQPLSSAINTQPFSGLPRVKKPVESGFF